MPARPLAKSLPNMFHGKESFRIALSQKPIPEERLDKFFSELDAHYMAISANYAKKMIGQNERRGIPETKTILLIKELSRALERTNHEPFSSLVSPYVDIRSGNMTELGELLVMPPEIAASINAPGSRIIQIMHSLADIGVSFEEMAKLSYESFGYARSGITTSTPGEPLLWLPLGNSLFLSKVMDYLRSTDKKITILNLGAGPGALESMVLANASAFSNRIRIVSIEQDPASLRILDKFRGKSGLEWFVLEDNFATAQTRKALEGLVQGAPFAIAGYSAHHISPDNVCDVVSWMGNLVKAKGYAQIHDVHGGNAGGGQSPVNRLFFNFMTLYHLTVFYPDNMFLSNGFSAMEPREASRMVKEYPSLFYPTTTPYNASDMLNNGSIAMFTKKQ